MSCLYCKHDMKTDKTTHVVELGESVIVIRHVPCLKCEKCGEVVYTGTVMSQIELIINKFKSSFTEVAVVNFSDTAA